MHHRITTITICLLVYFLLPVPMQARSPRADRLPDASSFQLRTPNLADRPTAERPGLSSGFPGLSIDDRVRPISLGSEQRESERTGRPILAVFRGTQPSDAIRLLTEELLETDRFKEWATETVVYRFFPMLPRRNVEAARRLGKVYAFATTLDVSSFPGMVLVDSEGDVIAHPPAFTGDLDEWFEAVDELIVKWQEEAQSSD